MFCGTRTRTSMNNLCEVLIAVLLVTIAHRGHAVLHGFTISPSYFISGITGNLTLRCDLGPYIHALSRATVLQLSKVDGQSVATLAMEQQSGGGPTLVARSLKGRAILEGKIDPSDLAGTYIQMTLLHPVASDSGQYMCSMTVMDHTNFFTTLSYNSSITLENATVDALLNHVNGLHKKIEDVTQHLLDSKSLNKALEDRMAGLEAECRNTTQASMSLQADVERLTENVRQLQSNLDDHLDMENMTCPASCIYEMDSLENNLNDTVDVLKTKLVDLVHAQDKETRVVFFARHKNVPNGLVALHHSEILKFHEVVVNEGGGYDSTTGSFVAPVNGTYVFLLNVPIIDKDPARQFNIAITVNFDQTIGQIENGVGKVPSSVTVVKYLSAGSEVTLYSIQVGGSQGSDTPMFSRFASYFGGFLLHEA